MKKSTSPTSPETDPRLLEALASLNRIGEAINQIGPSDAGSDEVSLQLIVESSLRVVPGSSAVIYTYDQAAGAFEKESRVSAEAKGQRPSSADHPDDAPRLAGIGMRTIGSRRRTISYEEPDLDIHPYHAARGVKAVACFPLIVAEESVGALYIYLFEEREFTYLEQLMLDNFVNQAAMAIYHARRVAVIRRDLLRKEEELGRLRRAIMSAYVEKQTFDRSALRRVVEEMRAASRSLRELGTLTEREREVLDLLAQGLTNKEIAEKLVITTNTVKRHLKAIFEKLGVHTRSAATAKASKR